MQRLTLYIPRIRQIKGHPQNKEQYLRIIHIELKFEEFNRFSFCGCPGYGGNERGGKQHRYNRRSFHISSVVGIT